MIFSYFLHVPFGKHITFSLITPPFIGNTAHGMGYVQLQVRPPQPPDVPNSCLVASVAMWLDNFFTQKMMFKYKTNIEHMECHTIRSKFHQISRYVKYIDYFIYIGHIETFICIFYVWGIYGVVLLFKPWVFNRNVCVFLC